MQGFMQHAFPHGGYPPYGMAAAHGMPMMPSVPAPTYRGTHYDHTAKIWRAFVLDRASQQSEWLLGEAGVGCSWRAAFVGSFGKGVVCWGD